MRLTIIFPKEQAYINKPLDVQRIYRNIFMKYLTLAKDSGCTVEYFLEDSLARKFVKEFGIENTKIITAVSGSDVSFFKMYSDLISLPDYVYSEFSNVENVAGTVEKDYTVPINLVREDRELYIKKRVDVFRKRLRVATDAYLKASKNVLMFRMDNNLDRVTPIRDTVLVGDGRLCIEVNVETGLGVSYYGGTFIPEEYISTIMTM